MLYFMSFKIIAWRNIKWFWSLAASSYFCELYLKDFFFFLPFWGILIFHWYASWLLDVSNISLLIFSSPRLLPAGFKNKTKQKAHLPGSALLAHVVAEHAANSVQAALGADGMWRGGALHGPSTSQGWQAGSVLKWFSKQVVCIYWSSKGIF